MQTGQAIVILVFVCGPKCTADDFHALTTTTNSTDRSGNANNSVHVEIVERLKTIHQRQWTTKYEANWFIWASTLISRSKRPNFDMEVEIHQSPPPFLLHLFQNPSSAIENYTAAVRRGSNSFLRMLDALRACEERYNSDKLRIYEQYRIMMSAINDEAANIGPEHDEAVQLAENVLNQIDFEHLIFN